MQIIIKRRVDGPSTPELGQPTSVTFSSVTVPLNRPSTGPAPISSYTIQRSLNGTTWTTAATGALIFGNPPVAFVDGGRLALTTYYYRALAEDTGGRVSDYCATVSVTTSAQIVSGFAPNHPHLGIGSPQPQVWGNTANWARFAQLAHCEWTHYSGAESVAGRTLRSTIDGIKALVPASMGAVPIHVAYIVNNEVNKTLGGVTADFRTKLDAEGWYLYVTGGSGAIVQSTWDPPNFHAINNTGNALVDGSGDTWIKWFFREMYTQNVTGNASNTANPSLDGFVLDNCFWRARVDGDFDRSGSTDAAANSAYALASRTGLKQHFDYARAQWPTARAQWGNISDLPESGNGDFYNNAYTPDYSLVEPLLGLIDGGTCEALTDFAFSKEYQTKDDLVNPLTGFWAIRNWMRFLHGICANTSGILYKIEDVVGDNSSADNQRLRFGTAAVNVCSNGGTQDNYLMNWATLPLIYTNGTNVGWLGQPRTTPRWSPYVSNVYVREFDNGYVAVNPRNNGSRTFTLPVALRNVVTGTSYAANASIPIADRDGAFLVKI